MSNRADRGLRRIALIWLFVRACAFVQSDCTVPDRLFCVIVTFRAARCTNDVTDFILMGLKRVVSSCGLQFLRHRPDLLGHVIHSCDIATTG
jgi:hypothetical protein